MNTRVYLADASSLQDDSLFEAVYLSVSEERRKKTDRIRFRKDKCLSLGAEYLLMCACREFGIDYKNESIIKTGFSKPVFSDSRVHFNLSHSGERVMCIMSEFPVGCDVEKKHPVNLRIAKRFFAEDEYRAIESCETQEAREDMFFRLWTLKESFMKCTGLGLSLPLNGFSISVNGGEACVKQSVDQACYTLFERNYDDGYRYAWCIKGSSGVPDVSGSEVQWKQIEIQRAAEN